MNNEYHPRQILALVPPALLQWDGCPWILVLGGIPDRRG